jgi:hypothetical protein
MKFYLSGGMEYKTNNGTVWRDWITPELEKHHHDAISPTKLELRGEEKRDVPIQVYLSELKTDRKFEDIRQLVRENLFRKDIFAIQMSDAIIVFYDESVQQGAGTQCEAWEAFREGKPIYLVTEFPVEKVPTWLIGETTQLFTSFEELLEYLSEHSHIIRDQMHARQIKNEVFGGLY